MIGINIMIIYFYSHRPAIQFLCNIKTSKCEKYDCNCTRNPTMLGARFPFVSIKLIYSSWIIKFSREDKTLSGIGK